MTVRRAVTALAALWLGLTLGMQIGPTAPRAVAHPHIWIDATVGVVAREGRVQELAVVWKFDPLFSAMVVADFDRNRNGRLDPDEVDELAALTVPSIAEFDYFTHLRVDDEKIKIDEVKGFRIEVRDRILYYSFVVPVEPPVDPRTTEISFSVFDQSYYTDLNLERDGAIRLMGDWAPGCRTDQTEDLANPIYFGLVFPIRHVVRCD